MSLQVEAPQQHPPLLLLHPHHRLPSSTCDLHPNETVTGFCASCLRERLAGLEASALSANPSAGPRKSTSALKSVFFKFSGVGGGGALQQPVSSSLLRPELRRCKSFSFARGDGFSGPRATFEPQRRSCDVRTTLWSLFHQDDQDRLRDSVVHPVVTSSAAAATAVREVINAADERPNLGFPVLESREEEEDGEEIRPVDPVLVVGTSGEIIEGRRQLQEQAERETEEVELKPMKDHIDVDSQHQQQQQAKKPPTKDLREIAGSFWLAASVFSKKLQKWRGKQKLKKQGRSSNAVAAAMPAEKPPNSSRRFRDTQSEVALDAFGRRSCDTDPRFSLDAGRMSFDDPRFSWEEPRASWDGYLIGGRTVFPRLPPMLSVVEDAPAPAVQRSDGLIPVEEDVTTPGGSTQTRDYYLDSSSRRRRSLDRSNSVRELPVEICEPKSVSNSKVSPAGGTEFLHFHNGNLLDQDLRDFWSSNSLRDEYSGSFESAFRVPCKGTDARKKSRRWSKAWNIWGFLQRKSSSRGDNVVDRSLSESWTELRSQSYNAKMSRSNSSVSCRSSFSGNVAYGSRRSSSMNLNFDGHGRKKRGEFVLDRNRSARYSPSHNDNGMLRFYLTPMRNSRRNGGSSNGRQISSHYFTKSMLGLY